MDNEYFKITQIYQKFRNGFRQYPFSICSFVRLTPGTGESVLGEGLVPDGTSIKMEGGVPPNETDSPELSLNNHIDPPFIYDNSILIGMKTA